MSNDIEEWDELLDQNWTNLKSFSLTSREVPHLLNTLKNNQEKEQRDAFYTLSNIILSPVDDGVVFEVTPKVIPCLAYLMKHSHKMYGAEYIASLLCELAIICDTFYYCYGVFTCENYRTNRYPEGEEVVLLIQAKWQDYTLGLNHKSLAVRIATIRLLSLIPDAWELLSLQLQKTLKNSKKPTNNNEQEIASALIAFAHCKLDEEFNTYLIEKFLALNTNQPTNFVQSAAAIAMVIVHQENTSKHIVNQLCHIQKTTYTTYYAQWYKGHLNEYADDLLNIFWPDMYDVLHL